MPVIRQTFSTAGLPVRDQRAVWQSWFSPAFESIWPSEDADTPFEAEATSFAAGGLLLGRVVAPPIHSKRTAAHVRRDPMDHWILTVGTSASHLRLADAEHPVASGAPFVISMADAVESRRAPGERLHIYLSRDRFSAIAPQLDRMRGRPIAGGVGLMLADYLRLLERSAPDLDDHELPRLADAVGAMLAACVVPTPASFEVAAQQIDLTRLEQVRRMVRARLHSATLTPSVLCRELGMSRSQLYRLLEDEGGVQRYVQRERLRAAFAALSDPADQRPIVIVAAACGFHDPSTFARIFRREFGVTASDARMAATAGIALSPAPSGLPAEIVSLNQCLRAL